MIEFTDNAQLATLQRQSTDLQDMTQYLENGSLPLDSNSATIVVTDSINWCLIDGLLYHLYDPQKRNVRSVKPIIQQLAVPKSLRSTVLQAYLEHSGHW